MNPFFCQVIFFLFLLCPFSPPAALASDSGPVYQNEQVDRQAPPAETGETPEQLKEEAGRLSQNFKDIFKDLSVAGQGLVTAVINSTADWIQENYEKLPADRRRKLQDFLVDLKKQYEEMEEVSVSALSKLLANFNKFLESLKNEPEPEPEPVQVNYEDHRI